MKTGRGRVFASAWRTTLALVLAVSSCGGSEFSSSEGAAGDGGAGGAGSTGTGGASSSVETTVSSSDAVSATVTGSGGDSSGTSGTSGTGGDSSGTGGAAGGNGGASGGSGGSPSLDASVGDAAREAGLRDVASDLPVVTRCPPTEPSMSTLCAEGLDCTYGTHPRPACRKEYVCSEAHWVLKAPGACPALGDCLLEQPKAPQVGAMCPTPDRECLFSAGNYCRCRPDPTGGATWDCFPPPTGCGAFPPNKGQECDLSAAMCAYGTCPLQTKVTTSCAGGIVHWAIACP
jgi:hypothetical protein